MKIKREDLELGDIVEFEPGDIVDVGKLPCNPHTVLGNDYLDTHPGTHIMGFHSADSILIRCSKNNKEFDIETGAYTFWWEDYHNCKLVKRPVKILDQYSELIGEMQ